jgi:hypothetical protein
MFGRISLWLQAYGFAWVLVIVSSLFMRRRMSHNCGVLAAGKLKIVQSPAFPPHELFTPGREIKCRIRHAPVSYDDDTIIQVRSASLKLADADLESPLDLEMNTGKISLFWTARNFFEFTGGRNEQPLPYRRFYDKHPRALVAAKDGIRRLPSSFAEMVYHTQTVQYFIGIDGVQRYVKFRLIPFDDVPESGVIPLSELGNFWSEKRDPRETRSRSYLKQEYADRLARGPIKYRLQLQLHTPGPDDTEELFNCNVDWDEATHPYMDVAVVEIQRLLSLRDEANAIFSLRHCPPSLGLIPARDVDDYNSINYVRARSDIAKKARVWRYKLFGSGPADVRDDPHTPTA